MTTPGPLLLIDDDAVFATVLARALDARGFTVSIANDRTTALALAREKAPQYAVLDLKLGAENGLALIPDLLAVRPELRILLLTGYASIATAVEAIKRGAHDYLAKPVDADQVAHDLRAAFLADQGMDEGFGDAHLGEGDPRVPDLVHGPVTGGQRESEQSRVGARECRVDGGERTLRDGGELGVAPGEHLVDAGHTREVAGGDEAVLGARAPGPRTGPCRHRKPLSGRTSPGMPRERRPRRGGSRTSVLPHPL